MKNKKMFVWVMANFAILIAVVSFGYYEYLVNYGGQDYYVQITNDGQKYVDKRTKAVTYSYQLPGYNEKGQKQILSFATIKPRPLKRDAYLKVKYNQKRQVVISWEQVFRKDITRAALDKLD